MKNQHFAGEANDTRLFEEHTRVMTRFRRSHAPQNREDRGGTKRDFDAREWLLLGRLPGVAGYRFSRN